MYFEAAVLFALHTYKAQMNTISEKFKKETRTCTKLAQYVVVVHVRLPNPCPPKQHRSFIAGGPGRLYSTHNPAHRTRLGEREAYI